VNPACIAAIPNKRNDFFCTTLLSVYRPDALPAAQPTAKLTIPTKKKNKKMSWCARFSVQPPLPEKNRLRSLSYSRRRGLQHVVTRRLQGGTRWLDIVLSDAARHHRYVICDRDSARDLRAQLDELHASGEKSSVLSFHTLTLSTRSLLITRCCNILATRGRIAAATLRTMLSMLIIAADKSGRVQHLSCIIAV